MITVHVVKGRNKKRVNKIILNHVPNVIFYQFDRNAI